MIDTLVSMFYVSLFIFVSFLVPRLFGGEPKYDIFISALFFNALLYLAFRWSTPPQEFDLVAGSLVGYFLGSNSANRIFGKISTRALPSMVFSIFVPWGLLFSAGSLFNQALFMYIFTFGLAKLISPRSQP